MNINGPKNALRPVTAIAGGAIKKGHALKRGADVEHLVTSTAGAACLGIALDDQDTAEKPVPYAYLVGERIVAVAGAAFAADVPLKSDASGKLVAASVGNNVVAISREAALADLDLVCVEIVAPGSSARMVGGQATTATALDTIATGLTTVASATANLESAPVLTCDRANAQVGDQNGAPVAGSIIIASYMPTSVSNPTPVAATTFGKKVNWIAIGV